MYKSGLAFKNCDSIKHIDFVFCKRIFSLMFVIWHFYQTNLKATRTVGPLLAYHSVDEALPDSVRLKQPSRGHSFTLWNITFSLSVSMASTIKRFSSDWQHPPHPPTPPPTAQTQSSPYCCFIPHIVCFLCKVKCQGARFYEDPNADTTAACSAKNNPLLGVQVKNNKHSNGRKTEFKN